jgi:hypothetical protein
MGVTVKTTEVIAFIECLLLLTASAGVGLLVGSLDVIAGIGAGLLVGSLLGFVLTLAYERGKERR